MFFFLIRNSQYQLGRSADRTSQCIVTVFEENLPWQSAVKNDSCTKKEEIIRRGDAVRMPNAPLRWASRGDAPFTFLLVSSKLRRFRDHGIFSNENEEFSSERYT